LRAMFLATPVACYGYGSLYERRHPLLEEIEMTVPLLPAELDGLRVVQLSDIHMSQMSVPELMERMVSQTNALQPDLIVVTGDLISNETRYSHPLAEVLAQLKAPLGCYACLGNHDVWHGGEAVVKAIQAKKVPVLVNQLVNLEHKGKRLVLAGLDSAWGGQPDFTTVRRQTSAKDPLLLMMHEPDVADDIQQHRRPLLQLSGHTHGGQVRIPFYGAPRVVSLGKRYIMGKYTVGDVQLYVNRGIGCVGLGVRFACPPEITLIHLRSPELQRA
jgi:uncharacterized protein